MIEHLQARLRQAMQDSAVEKQAGSEAQLEEQAIMLQQAYDRIQQLEDANSELQVLASAQLHIHKSICCLQRRHTCKSCAWRPCCLEPALQASSCLQSCRRKPMPLLVCMAEDEACWAGGQGAAQGPRPGARVGAAGRGGGGGCPGGAAGAAGR